MRIGYAKSQCCDTSSGRHRESDDFNHYRQREFPLRAEDLWRHCSEVDGRTTATPKATQGTISPARRGIAEKRANHQPVKKERRGISQRRIISSILPIAQLTTVSARRRLRRCEPMMAGCAVRGEALEQFEIRFRCGVEISGRLVGKKKAREWISARGNLNPLHLAAGKLVRKAIPRPSS